MIEGVLLGADQVLRFGDLVEKPRALVHSVLANVDVSLDGAEGASLAERVGVEDPALPPDGVEGEHLVDGHPEHFVAEKLAAGLMKSLMRP